MPTQALSKRGYAYEHIKSKTLMEDMAFRSEAPKPGDPMPDFDLPTVGGERLRSGEFVGRKPVLLITGSLTCPMTASTTPMLKDLHEVYGDRVQFVLLHVREAHPGEQRDQPMSSEEKMEHARRLKQRDALPFPVAVDTPDGAFHRRLDEKPNSVWLAAKDGRIVYRALWAGDEQGLRQALEAAARGDTPKNQESTRRMVPMAKGIGMMQEMVRQSGSRAQKDLIKAAPPMAAMAWIADKFRPLSPKWRGFAAMGVLGAVAVGAGTAVARSLRR